MTDDPVRRLSDATARLISIEAMENARFGLAVSGGADSMAMLAMAAKAWPGRIEVATVDHGLRAGSKVEAEMVAQWCVRYAIPHELLRPQNPITGNLQSSARIARYDLLESWCQSHGLDWLLTAHQADDQIETMIMRLNRGAGVGGLASIRGRQGRILRPMLGFRRSETRAYCMGQDVPFMDDPSNEDPRFDRVRVRQTLGQFDLIEPARLNRSVEALAAADQALEWTARQLYADYVRQDAETLCLTRTDMPPELLRRLLIEMIKTLNPDAESPRGPAIDQVLVQLFDAKVVTLGDCVLTGGNRWIVRRAPPRRVG